MKSNKAFQPTASLRSAAAERGRQMRLHAGGFKGRCERVAHKHKIPYTLMHGMRAQLVADAGRSAAGNAR